MGEDSVVRLARAGASVANDSLLLVLRDAAWRMLQQVIEAEVETFLAVHAELEDERGRQHAVRDGHAPERDIQKGIGPIAVRRPKLCDRGANFPPREATMGLSPPAVDAKAFWP